MWTWGIFFNEFQMNMKNVFLSTEVMQSKREGGWTTKKKCEKSEDPKALPGSDLLTSTCHVSSSLRKSEERKRFD